MTWFRNYSCAACQDPTQGEILINVAVYVAKDNVPKYWALCAKHYNRADDETKKHYAALNDGL